MAFTGTARILMQLNSCINPVIYASTIPAYKELARGLITCNLKKKMNDMEMGDNTSTNVKKDVVKSSENNI